MKSFGFFKKIIINILRWLIITLITFFILSIIVAYIANKFFDNAASKDSCADSGGAWDSKQNQCFFYSQNDPRYIDGTK